MHHELTHHEGALAQLARIDTDIAAALEAYGPPRDRSEAPGFSTLARVIIGQQISTKAAAAVWAKMTANDFHQSHIAAQTSIEDLRQAGLSPKPSEVRIWSKVLPKRWKANPLILMPCPIWMVRMSPKL